MYISYNKLSKYRNCPAIEFYNRDTSISISKDIRNSFLGTCVHKAVEEYIHGHINLLEMSSYVLTYASELEEQSYVKWRGKSDRGRLFREMLDHVANAHRFMKVKSITPLNSQAEVRLESDIKGCRFAGRVDMISTLDGISWIFDLKCTNSPGNASDDQIMLYLAMLRARGQNVKGGSYLYTKNCSEHVVNSDPAKMDFLINEALMVAERLEGNDLPKIPGFFCRWCDYKTLCPEGSGYVSGMRRKDDGRDLGWTIW